MCIRDSTSAGRVPSAKGYRYYLDYLLTDDQPLDRVTRARVDAVFASLDHEPEKLAQEMCIRDSRPAGLCAGLVLQRPAGRVQSAAKEEIGRAHV